MNRFLLLAIFALTLSSKIMKIDESQLIASEGEDPEDRQFCASWHSDKCSLCYASFFNGEKCQKVSKAIPNCVTYKADGECSDCQLNFGAKSGKCEKIKIDGCVRTLDNNLDKCELCKEGWKITLDLKCEETSKCTIENCALCLNTVGIEYCEMCKPGFIVYDHLDDK